MAIIVIEKKSVVGRTRRYHVVASYAVLGAVGQLSAAYLALDVNLYDPTIHLQQVRDKWIGLRTPSGM